MFRPHQVRRWREQVAADPRLRTEFDGHHLESVELDPTRTWHDSAAPVELGRLYPPERVIGQPVDPNCLSEIVPRIVEGAPPAFHTFRDARIIGYSALLTADGEALASHAPQAPSARHFVEWNSGGAQGFITEAVDGRYLVRFAARPKPRRIRQHAIFFPNIELGNHGSFVFRQLPQMLLLAEAGVTADCYIVAERTAWTFEALDLLGYPARPVFGVNHVSGDIFDQITMCLMLDMDGFVRPETQQAVRALVGRLSDRTAPTEPRKLFVSRDLQALPWPNYRPLLNEGEIAELACARGFQIVRPETLTLREQIRTFGGASHIMGPAGSGMLNAIFAREGGRVVDMDTTSCVRQHARLYASCGHAYSFLFGEVAADDDRPLHLRRWTVPPRLATEALDWCLG